MNKIDKVHCFFEQSGTFKNEFIKLGIAANDYDIQNHFQQTDYIIDLFDQINKGYDNEPSVFDEIKKSELIFAFFPCTYFECMQMTYYTNSCNNNNKEGKEKFNLIIDRINKRNEFYILLYKLIAICEIRELRLIIENPATQPHYLLMAQNFYKKPTFIDANRLLRGDYYKKPTAYWFFNIVPTNGRSYNINTSPKIVNQAKRGSSEISTRERSLISPEYAKNFICDFILGVENEYTQKDLFKN